MAGEVIGQPAFIDREDLAADDPDKLAAALIEPAGLAQYRDRFGRSPARRSISARSAAGL
jgi:hypothetical protein